MTNFSKTLNIKSFKIYHWTLCIHHRFVVQVDNTSIGIHPHQYRCGWEK